MPARGRLLTPFPDYPQGPDILQQAWRRAKWVPHRIARRDSAAMTDANLARIEAVPHRRYAEPRADPMARWATRS